MDKLVTIITTTFNRLNYLKFTIDSIICQEYRNIEYIVIDGDSTDGTKEFLKEYSNKYDFFYLSESDSGMYDAINKGLRLSNGSIIAYLNSDDRYFPWTVNEVVNFMSKNNSIDIIYGDSLVINNYRELHINIYPEFNSKWLKSGALLCQPTIFFKKEVFEKLGDFAKNVNWIGDCEYWLRALENGFIIKKLNEVLAIETNHPLTIRNTYKTEIIHEKLFLKKFYQINIITEILIKFLKYIEKEILFLLFCLKIYRTKWNRFHDKFQFNFSIVNYFKLKLRLTINNQIINNFKSRDE